MASPDGSTVAERNSDEYKAKKQAERDAEAEAFKQEEADREAEEKATPVWDEINNHAYWGKYVKVVCGIEPGKFNSAPKDKQEACNKKYFGETYLAKIAETYPYADWSKMTTYCQAHAIECNEDLANIERHAKELNQDAIDAHEREEYRREVASERERRRQAAAAFFQGLGAAFRPPVTCTSFSGGNITTTTCR